MRRSSLAVLLLSAAGEAINLYALQVLRSSSDVNYKPFCDFSRTLSCSAVLRSPRVHPLSFYGLVKPGASYDFSVATLGLLFYAWMSTFPYGRRTMRGVYLGTAALAVINSLAKVYATYRSLQVFCPVCLSTAMINVALVATIAATKARRERGRPLAADQKRKRG